jgi:hypothetical protein
MSKFRLVKPEEVGVEMADVIYSFHAELIKKGISKDTAAQIAASAAGAASSNSDGYCGDIARVPFDVVSHPAQRQR